MPNRIPVLINMLEKEPDDNFLTYALALEYEKTSEIQKGIQLLEKLFNKSPDYLPVYYKLGKLYEQVNRNIDAILILEKGIIVAQLQKNGKILSELNEALNYIRGEIE